jgi:hypothetical protein
MGEVSSDVVAAVANHICRDYAHPAWGDDWAEYLADCDLWGEYWYSLVRESGAP